MTTLCFGFNTAFQRELLAAWTHDIKANRVDAVLLARGDCPNATTHADIALRSARRLPRGNLGHRLKADFLRMQYNWIFRKLEKTKPTLVLIYNGLNGVNYLARAASRELGLPCLYFERAPLQDRVQIDPRGVNFQSSVPTDPDFYERCDLEMLFRLSSGNTDGNYRPVPRIQATARKGDDLIRAETLDEDPYVFCPLQVPRDTQITVFGGWIQSIEQLLDNLDVASRYLPPRWHVRIKEHPQSPIPFSHRIHAYDNPRLVLDNATDVYDQLANANAVLTINSSVGLEAFFYNKPVITLGQAFYSFGDLTARATDTNDLCELFEGVASLDYSQNNRDKLLKFLYFWFPDAEAVRDGHYTRQNLENRDEAFRAMLNGETSSPLS